MRTGAAFADSEIDFLSPANHDTGLAGPGSTGFLPLFSFTENNFKQHGIQ
tara:strand:+ start:102 stop:251 length:150 start_codon:yes stop_codon:yes gene_type:complete